MMKINEIRKKKESKQEELEDIKTEFKTVTKKQWLRFSLFMLFILLAVISVSFYYIDKGAVANDSFIVSDYSCNKSNECVAYCLNYYNGDGINHSLECSYKCLTYLNCDNG